MSLSFLHQPPKIQIFIACDNLTFFQFLEPFFDKEHIVIAGKADTAAKTIRRCNPMEIDVLLLDMTFGGALAQKVQSKRPLLKVIGVTREFEKQIIQAMRVQKMRGYIYIEPLNTERTVDCITAVARGEL